MLLSITVPEYCSRRFRRPLRNESYKSSTTRAEAPQAVQRAGQSPAIKLEARARATPPPSKPGSSYPAVRTSSLDVDAKPIHEPSGKPITEVDLDAGKVSLQKTLII